MSAAITRPRSPIFASVRLKMLSRATRRPADEIRTLKLSLIVRPLFRRLSSTRGSREERHRGVPFLADPPALRHVHERQSEDLEVEPQRSVVHVPKVELELLLPRQAVAAVHLHPPGDT